LYFLSKKGKKKALTHNKKRKREQRKRQISKLFATFSPLSKEKILRRRKDNTKGPSGSADKLILLTTLSLSIFGWIMIYSGSFYVASQRINTIFSPNNSYHFFILQGFWILIGFVVGFFAYKLPIRAYKTLVIPALVLIITLLITILLLPAEINGAKLWIKIGSFSLQPSEFVKPALIIYLAAIFSKYNEKDLKNYSTYLQKRIVPFAMVVVPITLLVLAGRDLATTVLLGMISIILFFMNDNHFYTNLTVILLAVVSISLTTVFTLSENYRMERVNTYIEVLETGSPEKPLSSGYQLNQILTAVGSGGFDGYGFGQSRQKYYYLQETAFNDTIFAVIAEEFGFLGSSAVIGAFALLVFRGVKIAQNAKNKFSSLLALGITVWIFLQAVIHLGVNVGLFPLTGITLPFMSYGGSSFISCMIGIGILLNISKDAKLE
jgi:cell division protein FtsW